MLKFPCFRDKKWIKENGANMKHPDEFLNVQFRPEFLKNYEHTVNFEKRAEQVTQQIKAALFRQAIYKVGTGNGNENGDGNGDETETETGKVIYRVYNTPFVVSFSPIHLQNKSFCPIL
ncbi:hypothetical protein POVWA2_026380 [Plasmodium ovale wallikeri]|uniref:Uncharacterized protein n=1 Tax=Plasmodium ovale wallikeri TaxID=864142 RepID=A0A1A8YUY0_PLAOA|nr:hypothetical protein POVWA1_026380 [Plasmodium ovale wallikeri]SBT35704.1 hypothetical protein POVWA2_026380 [Plasmodium ovale wallikeri]